jgi:hypothetical protein
MLAQQALGSCQADRQKKQRINDWGVATIVVSDIQRCELLTNQSVNPQSQIKNSTRILRSKLYFISGGTWLIS